MQSRGSSHPRPRPILRPLVPSDAPSALRLTRAAGWNQVPADWETLLSLEPGGCFAIECGGTLAATTTVICHGPDLAWIGMVLTAPEFRRRGFARLLLRTALKFAERRGVARIGLDATEMGAGLYRDLGFVETCAVERWQRPPGAVEGAEVQPYRSDPLRDREAFGADRAALLAHLAGLGAASLPGHGYAMGRPGAMGAYFGPCVGSSPAAVRTLLHWFLARHPDDNVFWDLLPRNREAVRIAMESGFAPARRLVRMARAESNGAIRSVSNRNEVFAIAGFEFG